MQVWTITDGAETHIFKNYTDLEPSIRISYHKRNNLEIETIRDGNEVRFRVSYDGRVQDELLAKMYPVWDAPCHL